MNSVARVSSLILGSLGAVIAGQARADADISGDWQAYASVAAPGTGSASTPAGKARIDAFYAAYGDDMPEAGAYCVPPGLPTTMTQMVSYPVEIVQSPGRITMLAELDMQIRRIFMDGRDFPPEAYWPTRMGYSIGHWEGETLVIETRYLNEVLSRQWPRTEKTRVVERVHRANRSDVNVRRNGYPEENDSNDLLVFDITVTDPDLYEKPQEITMYYQRVPDSEFLEYDCISSLYEDALDKARD